MYMFYKAAVILAFTCLVVTISGTSATSTTTEAPLPAEIKVCVDLVFKCNNKDQFSHEKIDHICSAISNENGNGYIVTPEDVNYFLSLLNDMVNQNRRQKRQSSYTRPIRREVRKMTLEHALRQENRLVTIPYWDSSLDYDMEEPHLSILWTSRFFGNGRGRVNTGPFVWTTGQGEDLIRNIGSSGTLISREFFNRVLSRTSHSEITNSRNRQFWLEGYHNGPHVWVDGQMSLLDSAAEDPVFWLHHCFIDYWWQKFMDQQLALGVNPYNDYPNVQGGHSATSLMDPFNITNRAGYSQYWYNNFYRYEDSPTCTRRNRNCYSRFLDCNTRLERCVSKTQQGARGQLPTSSVSRVSSSSNLNSVMPTLRMGRRFQSPFTDPRTTGQPLRQAPAVVTSGRANGSSARGLKPTNTASINPYMSFLKTKNRIAKRSVKYTKFDTESDMCLTVNERIRKLA
ncbi:hypothetical protein KUTeg_008338 [Tegillarca granosa]|uniref:Tyrosinase copper-binding domain-containing protein n=1 Tax=Tegillarca granosa TaxID=220873 RepID=A0ABQ9F8W9_TEGGR|nr:hypothetical protein KUTeg_008338 [Tegillarca granosa]